jgi:hypothetical protein
MYLTSKRVKNDRMRIQQFHDPQCFQPVRTCAWCPNKDLLCIAFEEGVVVYRLWGLAATLDAALICDFIKWAPDGSRVACISNKNASCVIFDIQTCQPANTFHLKLEDTETITMLNWTKLLSDINMIDASANKNCKSDCSMSMIMIGTSKGRLSLRLNGTLLIREILLVQDIPVLSSIISPNSFGTLTFMQSESERKGVTSMIWLDSCINLLDHQKDLYEFAFKCTGVDTLLNAVRVLIENLETEMKIVDNSGLKLLYDEIDNSFSDHDEPPSLDDWHRLALTGVSDIMVIQTISKRLLPKVTLIFI